MLQKPCDLGDEQDGAADRLNEQQGAGHPDRILKELQKRSAQNRAQDHGDDGDHGVDAVVDGKLLHVRDARAQVGTEAPFDVIDGRGEDQRPDKAGKQAFERKYDHGLVFFEQIKEILKFQFLGALLFHMMLFFHHEPADKRDRHGGDNKDHDDPGRGIVVAHAACVESNDSSCKHDIGNNAGEEGHQPRPDHQLCPLVFIGGHGTVKK